MSHLEKKREVEKSSSRASGEEESPSLLTMVGFILFDVRDFAFARSCGTRADFNQGQKNIFGTGVSWRFLSFAARNLSQV